ncbi:hypothetical protein Tco_1059933 [Tanacetum coccineum]
MADLSSHKPSSPEITPKEELVTLDKPKSPNPFLQADQVEFIFKEIAFTSNNEVALLYPSYPNSEYFREGNYKRHRYSREIGAKGALKKSCLPPRWRLLMGQEVPQGKKPGAKSGLRRKQSSKHTSKSKTEASKSKTGQSEKETQSSSAKDKSPSHPLPLTLVVSEIHKEAQQATGGPTSLGATSKEGAHNSVVVCLHLILNAPVLFSIFQLHSESASGYDVPVDSTTEADPRLSAPNDSIPSQQDESEEEEVIKDEDIHASSHDVPEDTSTPHPPSLKSAQIQELMAQVQLLQSQKDELEQQKGKAKAEVASLKAKSSYPDINQLTNLMVTSLKPELSKLLASHNFASCLPTELKELPSKFTELSGEIKELKQHVEDMEIELPGDLKEFLTKLETFTSTISSLTSQVTELKNIQWELPAELQALLVLVTKTLNGFATVVENASGATTKDVPSAGQATASPAEGENNTKDAKTNLKDELVDLLGKNVVARYYNKKLLFDKYCDKMMKRKKSPKIINCEVLTKKCPITLKIYREDGSEEVISNLKTRLDQLTQTEQELKIDLNKPLKEQDPLNELNELANKKRKRTSDLKDHSKSTKKHKSSSSA